MKWECVRVCVRASFLVCSGSPLCETRSRHGTRTAFFLLTDLALAPVLGVDEVDAAESDAAAGADGGLPGCTFTSSVGSVMMLPTPLYHQAAAQASARGRVRQRRLREKRESAARGWNEGWKRNVT